MQRLKDVITVEQTVGEIYNLLARNFPQERHLWRRLALEEENHARMLIMCRGFEKRGDLPQTVSVPAETILHTLDHVRRLKDRVSSGNITLREALEAAYTLELSAVENCLSTLLEKVEDRNIREVIGTLLDDGRSHADLIREAMVRHGFAGRAGFM